MPWFCAVTITTASIIDNATPTKLHVRSAIALALSLALLTSRLPAGTAFAAGAASDGDAPVPAADGKVETCRDFEAITNVAAWHSSIGATWRLPQRPRQRIAHRVRHVGQGDTDTFRRAGSISAARS